jgi:hypothetical protein
MKALVPVLAGIAVISGVVSASLWLELRTERQANAELRTQLAESRISSHQPVASVQPTAAPQPAGALPATAAASNPTSAPSPDAPRQARLADASATSATLASLASAIGISSSNERDLLKDPEYRKAKLAQLRIQLARSNPGLAEELGLSEREANQLFELMANSQLNLASEVTATTATGTTDVAARVQQLQARSREQTEAIRTMLGSTKYTQYQQYQQTLPARNQVVTMGSQLAAAGQPLSDAQSRALTTVMINEQERQRQQPPLALLAQSASSASSQQRTAQLLEESLRRQEETNRNVLDAASAHLNATQLATLRQQFEQQNAARRQTLTRLQEQQQRLQEQQQRVLAPPPRPQ